MAMRRWLKRLGAAFAASMLCLALATYMQLAPVRDSLRGVIAEAQTQRVTDRAGEPLSFTYQNRWNSYDTVTLHEMPPFLTQAFLLSEDRRFYSHNGVDWRARAGALRQNWQAGRAVRGASTVTEQVARMLTPRPRTLWSKWLETFEAMLIERQFGKAEIFEFYLNQLPYASGRRGVAQAARHYFSRDLATLTQKEMLALVVLARAPSGYDLYRNPGRVEGGIGRLAAQMKEAGLMDDAALAALAQETLALAPPAPPVNAAHFVAYAREHAPMSADGRALHTTLDAGLQRQVQLILDERVKALGPKNLRNAAALVADHRTGEIVAWVVAGADDPAMPGGRIDAVTVPRQPGSALKPFLYASALVAGWSPATLIDDSPLAEAIGQGLHRFRNYSNVYYGPVSLRDALGNSLNIPALRTVRHVGVEAYLARLHRLGFESLNRGAAIYDEGLALGNGEVTLLELVQAYAALAHQGVWRPLGVTADSAPEQRRVFSPEAASLIGNILSDPWARRLEFGSASVLNMPVQTAAKTGTSTDYRDAWAVGYNDRYVAGIWMGNLDHAPTDGITGSTGPALALRGIFSRLNQHRKTGPLYLSAKLERQEICEPEPDGGPCFLRSEYFMPGTQRGQQGSAQAAPELARPTDGLQMALDPRIPRERQKFEFQVTGLAPHDAVEWRLNGEKLARTEGGRYLWDMERGSYTLAATVRRGGADVALPEIGFTVK